MMALARDLVAAGGPPVWLWLASIAPLLLMNSVSVFGSWARRGFGLRWMMSGAPVVMFFLSLGAAAGIVASARSATIAHGLALARGAWPQPWNLLALQIDLALFGACLLALLAPVVALGAARPWMVAGRRAAIALFAGAATAVIVVALASVVVVTLDVVAALRDAASLDVASKHDVVYRAADAGARRLEIVRGSILALGALVALVAASASVRAARRGHRAGAAQIAIAALVLVCGLAAHALSRPLAADAASPPTLRQRFDAYFPIPGGLPRAGSCLRDDWQFAPILTLAAEGDVRLDGRGIAAAASLEDDLGTYRRNWGFLHPGERWPGILHVWAPATLPARVLAPWLAAANRADMDRVYLAVVTHETLRTRSLGVLEYSAHCVVPLALDGASDAVPLSALRDVGELARRAVDRSLHVDASK